MKGSVSELARHPVLFAETALRLCLIGIVLRFVSPAKIAARLARTRGREHSRLALALRFTGILERKLLRDPSCLRASLVGFWFAGEGAVFYIGVRKDKSGTRPIDAHAWLGFQKEIFSGARDYAEYGVLYSVEKRLSEAPATSARGSAPGN